MHLTCQKEAAFSSALSVFSAAAGKQRDLGGTGSGPHVKLNPAPVNLWSRGRSATESQPGGVTAGSLN